MKVSKKWLRELVDLQVSEEELVTLFNHKTIGTKEVTEDFIELDMKGYNRADLLSLRGVAYETGAITNSPVLFTELSDAEYVWVERKVGTTRVEIVDETLAEVQAVAKIEKLVVRKSPEEWVKKLNDSGMRSVNNVVDITNLVMLEFGYPLHAFDAKNVKDDTIFVRKAAHGEEITTLDGKKRILETQDIVLADDDKALDVAGVMGGQETEVQDTTETILLSASLFNPEMVRKTANRLGLHSEASKRFYHGLTRTRLLQALDGAIKLFEEQGGSLTSLTIVGDTQEQLRKIPLRLSRVNSLIGENLSATEVEEYLKRLNFVLSEKVMNADISWVITVPYFRLDTELEEDLVEEIARLYGYEKIKSQKVADKETKVIDQTKFNFLRQMGEKTAELGLTEVSTYPYFSSKIIESLGWDREQAPFLVKIKNPISKETEYLRQSVWPNLIEVIDKNARQGYQDIAIFEIGKGYHFTNEGKTPVETYRLAVALMNGSDNPMAELHNLLQKLNQVMDLGLEFKAKDPDEMGKNLFHPVRNMEIFKESTLIGGFSEVHKRVLDGFGIEKRVAIFEFDLTSFVE